MPRPCGQESVDATINIDRTQSFEPGPAAASTLPLLNFFIDKLQTNGNILYQDSCSYHELGSPGIKVPCRTLGE